MKIQYLLIIIAFISCCNHQIQSASIRQYAEWFDAAYNGNLATIEKYIGKVNINAYRNNRTALMLATRQRHENIVKRLLQVPGINVNVQGNTGKTALISAIEYLNENIVNLLLQIPTVNVNLQDQSGYTALMLATEKGHINIVKLLLDNPKININLYDNNGYTALIHAIKHLQQDIIQLLLQTPGINVNVHDVAGETALMWAAATGNINAVALLLRMPGININAQNAHGKTALILGQENFIKLVQQDRHTAQDIVARLIQNKIDELSHQAFIAIAAAHKASYSAKATTDMPEDAARNIQKFMGIVGQIGVKIKDKDGDTLLHRAIKLKNLKLVKFILLTDFTCLDMCDADGKDTIELAVGYPEVFAFIMSLTSLTDIKKQCANLDCLKSNCIKRCSRCREVFYCSSDCQKEHWTMHKHNCTPKNLNHRGKII